MMSPLHSQFVAGGAARSSGGLPLEQASQLDPARLRSVAAGLMSVADSLASNASADIGTMTLAAAERNQLALLSAAETEYDARRKRACHVGPELLGEPAWDILLDLFIQAARRKRVSIKSACQASCVPTTTALRTLAKLEARGMIERIPASHDRRVHYLQLTTAAQLGLARWLRQR